MKPPTLEEELVSGLLTFQASPSEDMQSVLINMEGKELMAFPATGGVRILGVFFSEANLESLRKLLDRHTERHG